MIHLKTFEELNYKMTYFDYLGGVNDYLMRIMGMNDDLINKIEKGYIHSCWKKGYTIEKCAKK